MQNRREFLKRASLMLAGGMVMPQLLSSCAGKASASESSKYIGLQLYSLRDLVKEEGIQKVLETASKMGYKNLETASYDNGKIYGLAPAEFKKMVNDLGMKCTSAHLGQAFTKEKEAEVMSWWDQAIDAHNELGVKYMVQPWMPVTDQTFKAVHIKDEKEIGASGKMNFKPIFDQMYANNIKDWYVEVEQYTQNDPVASVQQSYDYLNKADYVK